MGQKLRPMSISTTTRKAGPFTGNGVTVSFPFAFKVFAAADVLVVRGEIATSADTQLTLGTHYSVTLNSDQDTNPGGTVNWIGAPLSSAFTLTIGSKVTSTQPATFTNLGRFFPRVLNDALDRLTIVVQQLAEEVSRSVKVGFSGLVSPDVLVSTITTAASTATAGAASAAASAGAALDAVTDAQAAITAANAAIAGAVQADGSVAMTSPLTLSGNATDPLHALPLQQATGRLIAIRKFTAAESGSSYTKSPGTRAIYIKQCAGGGGGGGSYATGGSQYSLGCSAGAGSYAEGWFASGFDGAVLTIGSGGVAGTAAGNGGNGGTTSFGSLLSCPGGVGGIANGVVGSGGNWQQLGGAGGSIPTGTALLALPGETAEPVWTAGSLGFRGRSGASPLGTSIASNPSTGNGIDATVAANGYGVGGMGAFSGPSDGARVGGKGSDGVIFVYEFA